MKNIKNKIQKIIIDTIIIIFGIRIETINYLIKNIITKNATNKQ